MAGDTDTPVHTCVSRRWGHRHPREAMGKQHVRIQTGDATAGEPARRGGATTRSRAQALCAYARLRVQETLPQRGTGGWQVGGGASAAHTFRTFKTCPWSALWVVTTNSGSCSLSGNWTTETSGRAWRLPRAGWLTARPLSPVGELSATPVRTLTPSRGSTSRPVLTRHTGGGLGARASSRGCAPPHHGSGAVRHLAAR